MLKFLNGFLFLYTVIALPLQQSSLISIRTLATPRTAGGNQPPPLTYGPLILEEWGANGLIQDWVASCTLPGLSTETWTEGYLSPRYPYGDQVWFLCRNVPVNSSLSTNPAPVRYMYLSEEGLLNMCVEDFVYPNGTNVLNLIPYSDTVQGINVFYLLGGGTTANGPTSPARPAIPRIRVDSGFCSPADTEGSLLGFPQGITINQLRILDTTLYGTGLFQSSSGGTPSPTIFQIGAEGVLPTGTRNPTSNIAGFPLVLSVWTDPLSPIWWRTGFNRTAYVALYNNSDETDSIFPVPPAASAGTLGGVTWKVVSARKEGAELAVYLSNSSHIVKNTLIGLKNGLPYQQVLQAPSGWQYLSVHARAPNIPSPTATPTATATSSPSASSSASSTASSTSTSTSSPTTTSTGSATTTSSASSSPLPTNFVIPTLTASMTASPSSSSSASTTSSPSATSTSSNNNTNPYGPPDANIIVETITPGGVAGITLGTLVVAAGFILMLYRTVPSLRSHFVRFFGMSSSTFPKQLPKRRTGKTVISGVPMEISQNPYAIAQQRVEQLRRFQKKNIDSDMKRQESMRNKKQFAPVTLGESV
jgi:hypothetical protein